MYLRALSTKGLSANNTITSPMHTSKSTSTTTYVFFPSLHSSLHTAKYSLTALFSPFENPTGTHFISSPLTSALFITTIYVPAAVASPTSPTPPVSLNIDMTTFLPSTICLRICSPTQVRLNILGVLTGVTQIANSAGGEGEVAERRLVQSTIVQPGGWVGFVEVWDESCWRRVSSWRIMG